MELLHVTVIKCLVARGRGGARPNPSIICRVLLISALFMHCCAPP